MSYCRTTLIEYRSEKDADELISNCKVTASNDFPNAEILLCARTIFTIAVMTSYYPSKDMADQSMATKKPILNDAKAKAKTKNNKTKQSALPQQTVTVTTASVMTQLRTMAKKNKLRIRDLSTDVRQEQGGNWLNVQMEARGGYARIKSLIFGLQQRYSQLRMEKIRIEKGKRGSLNVWLRFSPGLLEQG